MHVKNIRSFLAATLLALSVVLQAQAGRPCEAQALTVQTLTRSLALAERTQSALNASGAQVVLLARNGQNLGEYGLRYSHMGFAYRENGADGKPLWRVVHKLNECGTAVSALYRQGLGDFFLDNLYRFEAAWVVPTPAVQQQLLTLLQDAPRITRLHQPRYSVVSYAWGQTYQQSNQWLIETLASAAEPQVSSREQAQAWLRFKAYEPTTLRIGPLKRLGGRLTAANVAFDDHPNEKRFSDRIETVTVDSVFAWLQRAQLSGPVVALLPQ